MDICTMTKRNHDHVCHTPIRRYFVKRMSDNMEGHLTICQSEKERLEASKWFKFNILLENEPEPIGEEHQLKIH